MSMISVDPLASLDEQQHISIQEPHLTKTFMKFFTTHRLHEDILPVNRRKAGGLHSSSSLYPLLDILSINKAIAPSPVTLVAVPKLSWAI
ncbi:hypothetical protein E2L07_12830 [Halalkalibacterium halodurans]|nr:hypothetical protein E2L07_12830 [Halalkalibacterium halodurans]